jgi:hypothetical protein
MPHPKTISKAHPEPYFPFNIIALFADNIFSKRHYLAFYLLFFAPGQM